MKSLPIIDLSLANARVFTEGHQLIVSSGSIQRIWRWTEAGFATVSIRALAANEEWTGTLQPCDWQLPDGTEPKHATLLSLDADIQDDEGFTSEHIAIVAHIAYANFTLRWTLWVYPKAPGLRTQMAAKITDAYTASQAVAPQGGATPARNENIPIPAPNLTRRFFGYYNETQQRNDTHQNILKEDVVRHPLSHREWCNWASVACMESAKGGIALVKESHKCVNQNGYNTGGFIADESTGLACTGWGLVPRDLNTETFTAGWATWQLVWHGGDLAREVAFKTFDRIRYPLDPERDIYTQANTWGSTDNSRSARRAACEDSVLQEIDACAEIGIDVLQIDDGWQVPPACPTWNPGDTGWHPHPESYPQGWQTIKTKAAELGIKLGLWAAAEPIALDELKANHKEGAFLQFKLDFANLRCRETIDALMTKVRDFVTATGHSVRVNWDVTENPARYGYFFAREYGCIYLENRKPEKPLSVIYRPHTVLRDIWQISKYLNIHKFQCSVQNVDRVDPNYSDAHLHSHSYATAIALVGIPLFFQETKYLSPEARNEIRSLLNIYKQHREAMFRSTVHPIGLIPDNASWTGFQCHIPERVSGYLLLFRERCNPSPTHTFELAWLAGSTISLQNLIDGQVARTVLDAEGHLECTVPQAPGFLFLQYQTTD